MMHAFLLAVEKCKNVSQNKLMKASSEMVVVKSSIDDINPILDGI